MLRNKSSLRDRSLNGELSERELDVLNRSEQRQLDNVRNLPKTRLEKQGSVY